MRIIEYEYLLICFSCLDYCDGTAKVKRKTVSCPICRREVEDEEQCRVYQETACTTQYVERSPGQHVGDTRCEDIPVNYCTRENCRMVPGPQKCHDKVSVLLLLSGC